jgi:hypothetical protein
MHRTRRRGVHPRRHGRGQPRPSVRNRGPPVLQVARRDARGSLRVHGGGQEDREEARWGQVLARKDAGGGRGDLVGPEERFVLRPDVCGRGCKGLDDGRMVGDYPRKEEGCFVS